MEQNKKLEFFGDLAAMDSLAIQALKKIDGLWESGQIRFLPDDLKLMNERVSGIKKSLTKILSYNHSKFSKITNSAIEPKVEIKLKQ